MGVNVYPHLSWRENLKNIMWNTWLYRNESEKLETLYRQNLPDEDYKEHVLKYIGEINSRLGYWEAYQ